jgi:uncharacterized protein
MSEQHSNEQLIDLVVSPETAADQQLLLAALLKATGSKSPLFFEIVKRSIDARSRHIKVNLRIKYANAPIPQPHYDIPTFGSVANAQHVVIIGAGPAGLFAALSLIEKGIKPIIFERGKNVRERRHDLAAINKQGIVNADSNYCFGEGGAGTYSDGKLYTRSDKRGNIKKVLELFVRFGADTTILVEAHPHIGTNKLPKIITKMRECILDAGGEIHFNSRVTDIHHAFGKVSGVEINGSHQFSCEKIILATGHSARDIFELLHRKQILIEAKPFALGVRVEHPQQVIDSMQYHCADRGPYLPPSSYSIVQQVQGRGVYSFCMCPGGIIAPCATANGEVVTNGWSPSKRNNPFANSGFVVSVELKDLAAFASFGPLAALQFQKTTEQLCYTATGGKQQAPAQRLVDFVQQKVSNNLPDCSYQPGIISTQLNEVLPSFVATHIREALQQLKSSKPQYFTNEAVLVAPESRTSSPVKIPRDKDTLEHVEIKGLYPCGEGAGYAGGIVSAAMDGMRIAEIIRF